MLLIATFTSCEQSTENVIESKKSKVKELKFSEEPTTEGLCKDGYEPVWEMKFVRDIFEKFDLRTCKDGWGMCFQFGYKFIFDCKRILHLADPASRASFNNHDGSGVTSAVKNEVDKTITLIFDKSIEQSGLYNTFNFDHFSVGSGCFFELETRYNLIEGIYPKVIDGDYIKYTIPYVE